MLCFTYSTIGVIILIENKDKSSYGGNYEQREANLC